MLASMNTWQRKSKTHPSSTAVAGCLGRIAMTIASGKRRKLLAFAPIDAKLTNHTWLKPLQGLSFAGHGIQP